MEDLEQKNQIKETVNQLYALRAGLSLVDKEHDKTSKIETIISVEKEGKDNRISALENSNSYIEEEIENISYNQKRDYSKYESKVKNIKKQLQEIDDKYNLTLKSKAKSFKIAVITLSITLICIAAIALFSILAVNKIIDYVGFPMLIVIVGGVGGFVAFIFFLVNISNFFSDLSYMKSLTKEKGQIEKIEEYKEDNRYSKLIDESNNKIKENSNKIQEIENKYIEHRDEAIKEMTLYSKKGTEMYNLVVSEFSKSLPSLDQRDYKHVDLIIYLLETGRAETMKEALQQVDTYVHTEKIVQAIDNASQTISQCIMTNIQSLRNTIEKNTYALGEKIDRLTYNVSTMSDNQAAFAKELNEKLAKTNSSLEMQKALLEKSSVSSAEMANNIEKMRLYADEAYIRNVNKW